ncbi:MAG: sulfite exporter TauE/SafE family protein [Paracoccaceae bacterium]
MLSDMASGVLGIALLVVLFAGCVKGAVGFGMPMILISGLGTLLPAETAIAALILPTVLTNFSQALSTGIRDALATFRRYWRFNLVLFVTIFFSAQLVRVMPQALLFSLLGGSIVFFTLVQLAGWHPRIGPLAARIVEIPAAMIAGFFGGLTGVWGPPTILYLTALDVPKADHVRAQGVVYFAGSILLLSAHLKSGVLNGQTLPLSALLVVPALVGQWTGRRFHDSIDQVVFRRLTLIILTIAGLNLLRRGLIG